MQSVELLPEIGVTKNQYDSLIQACRILPQPQGDYHQADFISNLLLTVLDYQLRNAIVYNAWDHYRQNHWIAIRSFPDLERFLSEFTDDRDGNTKAAIALWGYKYWNRLEQLRRLVHFFKAANVVDQETLKGWAEKSDFNRDFAGKVSGLGLAVFRWLQIRVGVETIKPDVHIKRFVSGVIGSVPNDEAVVCLLNAVSREIGRKAHELDWSIWEYQRGGAGKV